MEHVVTQCIKVPMVVRIGSRSVYRREPARGAERDIGPGANCSHLSFDRLVVALTEVMP